MWKRDMSQEEVLLRLKSEYPLPDGIGLNPESLIRLLKVLEKVAPQEQFIKTVKLITRVFERKTDECLKNGYAYAVACGDHVSAQKCMYLLQNKYDLLPLHNIPPEDSNCVVSDGSKVNVSSSTVPQNSIAINQVSAIDERERSVKNRLFGNSSTEPSEHNSFRRPLAINNPTEKQIKGRKHKFSETGVQSNQNFKKSGGSESDVSPKRSRNSAKRIISTRKRDRRSRNISRDSYSDDDKFHSNRGRSKTIADDYSLKDDNAGSGSSTRRQGNAPRRSQSTHDLSVSPSPARRRIAQTQLKNRGKIVAHSDSDVLDYSSKRKPTFKNKKVLDSGKSIQCDVKPRHHIHSSESESECSNVREDSRKQSSLSRRNIFYDRHGNKVRGERIEESESDESEDLFQPSRRKRPLPLEQGKLRTAKHFGKYSRAGSESDDESSPQRTPGKIRRLNRLKSVLNSDSDNDLRMKSGNNKTNNYKGGRNRPRTSIEISCGSNSDSNDSPPTKKSTKSKAKYYAETASEIDTVSCHPIKRKQTIKNFDSEQLSNKASKPRSKSCHQSTSTTKKNSKGTIKSKTKRDVYSDTDVPLDNSSKKKTANKSTKKLPDTREKASAKIVKKQTPKQDSKQKNTTCKSGKETSVKKNLPKKKPTDVKQRPDSNENGHTPDLLTQKKGKNSNKSVASKTTESSNGKKPPSANRKKPLTKSNTKNNSKSATALKPNGDISDKTTKPVAGKKKKERKNDTAEKKIEKSSVEKTKDNVKPKAKRAVKKKTDEKKPVKKAKGRAVKEPDVKTDDVEAEDKSGLSLLASDHSFMSDSELDFPIGSLSTCLNSIKRQMPRPLGSATPPLSIFLRASSEVMSEVGSDISSLDRLPAKLDDKNVVKRMAKANKPDDVQDQPFTSKQNPKISKTPEALRKIVNIKKKLEEKETSDIECSSFSD